MRSDLKSSNLADEGLAMFDETAAGQWLIPGANSVRHRQFWVCRMVDLLPRRFFSPRSLRDRWRAAH
jgi:hypothetical protein